jgi:hypothetical protein
MEAFKTFIYINIKYKNIVPLLEKTLRTMKAEGVIDKYCRESFGVDADLVCTKLVAK